MGNSSWKCSKCQEDLEAAFDTCWRCGTHRDGKPAIEPELFAISPAKHNHFEDVCANRPVSNFIFIAKFARLLLLFVVAAMFLDEKFLILGYTILAVYSFWAARSLQVSLSILSIMVLVTAFHMAGFKLYGRPVSVEIQSLKSPERVTALEIPNLVRLENGESFQLRNVILLRALDFTKPPTNSCMADWDLMAIRRVLNMRQQEYAPVALEATRLVDDKVKLICLQRASYWCGNTWFPRFFPRRLSRHLRVDFEMVLATSGIAIPSSNHVMEVNDPRDPVMMAFARNDFLQMPPCQTDFVDVARALFRKDELLLGAQLIVETRGTNYYRALRRVIEQATASPTQGLYGHWANSESMAPLLMRIDPATARTSLTNALANPKASALTIRLPVCALTEWGKLEGYDYLFAAIESQSIRPEARKELLSQILIDFRFLSDLSKMDWVDTHWVYFLNWYRAYREQLTWKHTSDGRKGFALRDHDVFDETYLKTIEPYRSASLKKSNNKVPGRLVE